MKAVREDRLNWKIKESTTTKPNKRDLRCVLLEQVEMGHHERYKFTTGKNPRDEQGGTLTTQRKPVTSFPRTSPSPNIRNQFSPQKSRKSLQNLCASSEDSYNATKPTGTILVRFVTVEKAAAAIFARQTPKTVELKIVKGDEHQAAGSRSQVSIAEFQNG